MTPPTVTTDLLAHNFNLHTPDLAALLGRTRPAGVRPPRHCCAAMPQL